MGVVFALLSSALWGTSDFLGGTASRRLPAMGVVIVSEAAGLLGVLVVAGATGAFSSSTGYVGWGLLGALSGVFGITAFYRGLATGTMSVVSPIAALGVAVPVAVGVIGGDRPSLAQDAGVVVAVIGVVLASGPELGRHPAGKVLDERSRRERAAPLLLAMVAALGFGLFYVCLDHGAQSSTWMSLVVMRSGSVLVLLVASRAAGAPLHVGRADLPLLTLIGFLDVGANAAFAVASQHGLLSVVAVLSSLYPAVTVVLAQTIHDERLQRAQLSGVIAALAGVILLASGGAG